ncbi:GTP cyclohydrolase I [Enterococcus sp. DIV0212c]|uniref:GTP cyclohydrolase I FolE n=1 Tax=Enterococcus sp. DIV0212c TaxID=2230867 RepID=UPI001A9AE4DF|nr:GTP cyclohydrolase I FolE [Enterococcus sp. DIV0212c]MBO1352923.1 GTP cyclohydrolase I FolE [Enterococcus sp. DIV0212c]
MNNQIEIIEESVKNILVALGEDINRPGLKETPRRVAKMYEEVFIGIKYTNHEIAEKFNKCFDNEESGIVIVKKLPAFSYCEHHLALMFNMDISVGYIPKGKVIGLSKIARIVDLVCKRLQIQERIGKDVCEILKEILDTEDVIVCVEGEHSCMRARGIRSGNSMTSTYFASGVFKESSESRQEFFRLI